MAGRLEDGMPKEACRDVSIVFAICKQWLDYGLLSWVEEKGRDGELDPHLSSFTHHVRRVCEKGGGERLCPPWRQTRTGSS